jgi:diaminopimelate epimerase
MHGIGNDFVLIDTIRDGQFIGDVSLASRHFCDRNTGVGADGLILVERSGEMLEMKMFNPDGSASEMCGNGLRTFGRLCHDRAYGGDEFPVKTGAGILTVKCLPGQFISINMGQAILDPAKIGMVNVSGDKFVNEDIGNGFFGTAISMGNPHLVIFVDDVKAIDLEGEGVRFENSRLFQNRTNVHFIQVISDSEITQRTWERGAGATLACGTGACASAVAAYLNHKTGRNVKVNLQGGTLQVDYLEDGSVQMTGSAEYSFDGVSSSLL